MRHVPCSRITDFLCDITGLKRKSAPGVKWIRELSLSACASTRLVIFALALFLVANGPALLRTGLKKETERGTDKESGREEEKEIEEEKKRSGEMNERRETGREEEREWRGYVDEKRELEGKTSLCAPCHECNRGCGRRKIHDQDAIATRDRTRENSQTSPESTDPPYGMPCPSASRLYVSRESS